MKVRCCVPRECCRRACGIQFNPLTAGAAYIRVFIFISTLSITFFKYVQDIMGHQPARFEKN